MKTQKTFRISAPKLKLKTIGFIDLISRNKATTARNKVKIYKSKTLLHLAQVARKAKEKFSKLFNQSFAQVAILESSVILAKNALKEAKKHILSSVEYFTLHVNLLRAYKHLNSFKYSLPYSIKSLLF